MRKLVDKYATSGVAFDAQQVFQRYTFDVIGLSEFIIYIIDTTHHHHPSS